jgi:hypothetical protein
MALPTLKFFIDPTNNNAYYGLNDNTVITDPYFFYGDTKTIELYLRQTVNGTNQLITWPASPTIKVSLGPIDDVPTAGTFTVTYGGNSTTALAYNITAAAFQTALKAYGMKSSMSRKGNCWDNAPTESLWGSPTYDRQLDVPT